MLISLLCSIIWCFFYAATYFRKSRSSSFTFSPPTWRCICNNFYQTADCRFHLQFCLSRWNCSSKNIDRCFCCLCLFICLFGVYPCLPISPPLSLSLHPHLPSLSFPFLSYSPSSLHSFLPTPSLYPTKARQPAEVAAGRTNAEQSQQKAVLAHPSTLLLGRALPCKPFYLQKINRKKKKSIKRDQYFLVDICIVISIQRQIWKEFLAFVFSDIWSALEEFGKRKRDLSTMWSVLYDILMGCTIVWKKFPQNYGNVGNSNNKNGNNCNIRDMNGINQH